MEEEKSQVNVQMSIDLQALLDKMVADDESDRSKFIRRLIRQEHARRMQEQFPPLVTNNKKPNRDSRAAVAA